MPQKFDFKKFHQLLYTASKQAFIHIQQAHKDESFYIFALYTCGDLGYVVPTSSTEEGLLQKAKEYSTSQYYKNSSIEQLCEELRWSPCDSPLHAEGEEFFKEVNDFLLNITDILDSIPTEDSWDEFNSFCDQFFDVCVQVLQELDKEGVFGTGERRNLIVLNILMGDQGDVERLEFAKRLNPEDVFRHFEEVYHA